jgi:PEP-CTERM motif
MNERFLLALFSSVLLVGPASAGPITVVTSVWEVPGSNSGEIPVPGLGNWALLTWDRPTADIPAGNIGGVTVAVGQTSASGPAVGFWPVMQFSNLAQYQTQRTTVVAVPPTHVQLLAEVWDGNALNPLTTPYQRVFINATVSAQVSPTAGQNTVDWQFTTLPAQVTFGDGTVVSIDYQAVVMPAGVPQIQFQDGTPSIGFPGPTYYPTVVDVDITVSSANATPEPSSAVLLAGLALGGLVARRSRRVPGRA